MILAVYGTLRRDGRLHTDYLTGAEYLGTELIDGWDMYPVEGDWYPYVTPGDGSVLVEVYDVEATQGFLTGAMEIRAGYSAVEVETESSVGTTNGVVGTTNAYMFVYDMFKLRMEFTWMMNQGLAPPLKIEHGDWIKYITEQSEQLTKLLNN